MDQGGGRGGDRGPKRVAVIIGAGPAGLTAAYELLEKTDILPLIFEQDGCVGGICRTVEHHGNRMDIGGHRFFSKSDRVLEWWSRFLPLDPASAMSPDGGLEIGYHGSKKGVSTGWPAAGPSTDRIMLVRSRRSRILFLKKLFDYPISLAPKTLLRLGVWRSIKIMASYAWSQVFRVRPEKSLEDFFINRFGRQLYRTFFKSYTEKVWGVPCDRIGAEWGAQRVKSLSLWKAVWVQVRSLFISDRSLRQRNTPTSLIERFMYPKFGPGQLWEEVASQVKARGAEIHLKHRVVRLDAQGPHVGSVRVLDAASGVERDIPCDFVISTMPVKDLVKALGDHAPAKVQEAASRLQYRDFLTVGLLLGTLTDPERASTPGPKQPLTDNWIYVQEPYVQVGRIQIFNNWSPCLVRDPGRVWIGMEYFCDEGDELWSKPDPDMIRFAMEELTKIGMADPGDFIEGTVVRMSKTYPGYFGAYSEFPAIRAYTDGIENLFLVGRNGMHRYNNQDHSMLTAMAAVENIVSGVRTKQNLWEINTEDEYHEQKKT